MGMRNEYSLDVGFSFFVSRFGNIRICVFKFRRVFIFGVSALGHDMQGLPAPTSNAEQVGRGAGTPFHMYSYHTKQGILFIQGRPGAQRKS